LWKQVILAANLIWRTTGVQPTASQIRITLKAEFPIKSIQQAIETDEFAVEMNRCGIPWHTDLAALDQRQMAALIEVSNPLNTTPLAQKLAKLQISQHEWTAWKKNPTFQQKLNQLTFELSENYRPEIDALVMARSLEGNLSYITYMDARNKALNEELTQASYNQKIKIFLASVFEALSEELSDNPELLGRVASRLNQIQSQRELPA
jgi:hypothetical protein